MDRQLLARATDSSEAPTPGYLYLDIAKNAASSPTACQEIATYLIRKLEQKSNYNIKFKCCKVMAQLSVSPVTRGQFKRCLAQDANAVSVIKEHLQFRGPPDPARGDEIYERVRVAAKEALDAIYSDTPATTNTTTYDNGAAASPYGGTGMSTAHHAHAHSHQGGGGGGPRRMEGIGNPMFADPRLTQRPHNATSGTILKDVMREAGQTIVGMIKDPLARGATAGRDSRFGSMPRPGSATSGGYGGPGYGVQPPGRAELVQATGGQWTMASNRGHNSFGSSSNSGGTDTSYYKAREASGNNNAYSWAQQQQQQQSNGSGGSGGMGVGGSWASSTNSGAQDYATPSITITSASVSSPPPTARYHTPTAAVGAAGSSSTPTTTTGIVSDGSYERALILELCPPGGMKAEPPPDKLASFAKSVASLNPDLVCPVLLDCLEEGQPWLIRAKALHVMDACVQNGKKVGGSDENPYANFFYACRGEIEPLAHHARSAIRDPAKRVLESLGIPVVAETTSTAFAQQQQQQPLAALHQQQQPPPSAAPPVAIPNLLDFDDDDDNTNSVVAEPPPVPMAPPPAGAPPPPSPDAPTTLSSASLFGGLKVQASAGTPSPASGNLLGDFTSPTSAAPVAATPSSGGGGGLFGDVVVKQPAAKQEVPSSATTTTTTLNVSTDVSSLLGDLTIADQSASASNGSAFGFINQTASANATSQAAASSHPPALSPTSSSASSVPPKQSFDPLLNPQVPSPNSARAMMQLSQEQMKAMAYQQMIMQQQLQMAMALQHQQQHQQHPFLVGPGGAPTHHNIGGVVMPVGGMPKPMMGVNAAAAVANSPFSFLENNPHAKQDDKRFDFVKDAMKHESKK